MPQRVINRSGLTTEQIADGPRSSHDDLTSLNALSVNAWKRGRCHAEDVAWQSQIRVRMDSVSCRSEAFWTFPLAVKGNASTNLTYLGTAYLGMTFSQ